MPSNDHFKKSLVSADKQRKPIRKSPKVYDVYGDIPSEDIVSDNVRPQLTLPAPAQTLDGCTDILTDEVNLRESHGSTAYNGCPDTPTDEDFRKSIESVVHDECGDKPPEAGPQLSLPAPAYTLHGPQEMRQLPSALYDILTETSLPTPTSSVPMMPTLTTTTRPQSMMESDEFSPPGFTSRTATEELSVWTSLPVPANSVPMASTSNSSFPGATAISMNVNNVGHDDTARSVVHAAATKKKPAKKKKPANIPSFAALCFAAISSSNKGFMYVDEIYQWLQNNYSCFHPKDINWKNSVRNILSRHPGFEKRSEHFRYGCQRSVHPASLHSFQLGDFNINHAKECIGAYTSQNRSSSVITSSKRPTRYHPYPTTQRHNQNSQYQPCQLAQQQDPGYQLYQAVQQEFSQTTAQSDISEAGMRLGLYATSGPTNIQ